MDVGPQIVSDHIMIPLGRLHDQNDYLMTEVIFSYPHSTVSCSDGTGRFVTWSVFILQDAIAVRTCVPFSLNQIDCPYTYHALIERAHAY